MRELYRDLVDKNVITFTTDKNYLPFAKILVNSIKKNSPNLEIVGRFVNCSDNDLLEFKNISIISDTKKLSTIRNLKTKEGLYAVDTEDLTLKNKTSVKPLKLFYSELIAYCSNIKFNTIKNLLKHNIKNVLYLDVDSIVRGRLDTLFEDLNNHEFCFYKDKPYSEQLDTKRLEDEDFLYHGGLIGVHNNSNTNDIINWACDIVEEDIFDWDVDERIITGFLNKSNSIKNINVKFKDEMLETNSIIWSGSGNTKFTQDRYIEESKKYGTL